MEFVGAGALAEDNLARVAAWTHDPARRGRSVILVGHSSADGGYGYNVRLSRERAREVAARLHALDVDAVTVIGVGPISPISCEGTGGTADLNRRVEVWVR